MVALEAAIHDSIIALLGDAFLGDLGVDPVGETPHLGTNLAKLDIARGVVSHGLLESLVELAVVEENIGVVEPPIKVTLDRLEGLQNTIQLLVSGEDDKGGIGAGLRVVGLLAAGQEDLVVLFANFPAQQYQGQLSRSKQLAPVIQSIGTNVPNGGWCPGGHQYPARRGRVLDEQDEDEDDDEDGEDDDDAKGYGNGRVSP